MNVASKEMSDNIEGTQFHLDVLIVFLSNVLYDECGRYLEKPKWDRYHDLTNKTAFLKSKFKQTKKITRDQLFSCNSKLQEFSLPRYFFSYIEIKSEFKEKPVIICTNADINTKGLEDVLVQRNAKWGNLLHCEDVTCSFFTLNEDAVSDLKASAEIYFDKNLQGKGIDKSVITDESVKEFLKNLQFFCNYPSGDELHKITAQLFNQMDELWRKMSRREIYKKIGDWFNLAKGEHLTELRIKAMLREIRSDQYCEMLKNCNVSFAINDLDIAKSERIIHVKVKEGHLLQMLKIYRALRGDKRRKLFVNPEDTVALQKQAVEAFSLHRYTYLIMTWTATKYETAIKEIISKLREILHKCEHKKIILVAGSDIDLAQQFGVENVSHIDGFLTFQDLSKNSQQMLLKAKKAPFQGYMVNLEELLNTQAAEDFTTSADTAMLERLVRGEAKVGVRPLDADECTAEFYISRKSNADNNEVIGSRDILTEESLYSIKEKVIVISNSASPNKSTVLAKMASTIKKNNNHLWVIKLNLSDYTEVLSAFVEKGRNEISAEELLNSLKATKMTDEFEKLVFSISEKVVLMLDGVDEINPDYKHLVLSLLNHCLEAPNFFKIFVITRPHVDLKLLEAGQFQLLPFTRLEQRYFLADYWSQNLNLSHDNIEKCEHYAEVLTDKVFSWTTSGHYCQYPFFGVPLQVKLLAAIFLENIKEQKSSDWQSCREYLESEETEPKLPERFNVAKLYDAFIEKKRDVFIAEGIQSGSAMATPTLLNQFESCLAYHRSLAVVTLLPEYQQLFKIHIPEDKDTDWYILKIGIVHRLEDGVHFKHRSFAEHFVAHSIVEGLKLQNPDVSFQRLLIDVILRNDEFENVRAFLDMLLQGVSLPPNNFKQYRYLKSKEINFNLIFQLALEGHVAILRFILLEIAQVGEGCHLNLHRRPSRKRNTLHDLGLLVQKEGVNIKREGGEAPLHLAVRGGHLEMVEFLVEQGADVNMKNGASDSALRISTRQKNWNIFKYLVEHGADVNAIDDNYNTSLHHAVEHWEFSVVGYLVEHGADVNYGNIKGFTALHLAAELDKIDIVEYLLKHGANINAEAGEYYTALHVATSQNNWNNVKYLIEHGADINVKTDYDEGLTALHLAAMFDEMDDVKENDDGTELHLTARQKNWNIIKCLVEHGAPVDTMSFQYFTPLYMAARADKMDVVGYFLEHGADIDVKDIYRDTPLLRIVFEKNWNMAKYLVEHGADVNAGENDRYTPLQLAVLKNEMDMVVYFVENGANINGKDGYGTTALYLATYQGDWDIVKYLIEQGADVNVADSKGRAVMHFAAKYNKTDIVEIFLERGVDINVKDQKNRTALHMAIFKKHCNMVKFLVEHGADINVKNDEGHTALHYAVRDNLLEIVDFLVLCDAKDVNCYVPNSTTSVFPGSLEHDKRKSDIP